jgi:hypothetical protein
MGTSAIRGAVEAVGRNIRMAALVLALMLGLVGQLAHARDTAAHHTTFAVKGVAVFNGTTTPVPNATVDLYYYGSDGEWYPMNMRVTTGSDGRYYFSGLQTGYYYAARAFRAYSYCSGYGVIDQYWGWSTYFTGQRTNLVNASIYVDFARRVTC